LSNNELLLLRDVLLDVVEQKGDSSASLLCQPVNSYFEALDAFRTCDWDSHLFALVKEVLDAALGLLAHFDAEGVRQHENLNVLVEVNEVGEVFVAEGFNHGPRVVLRNGNAVQFHLLGSKSVWLVNFRLSCYLKIPISSNKEIYK